MDRIDAMRIFTRVLERQSFTQAAEDLNLARSTVTDAVKRLEQRIGVMLLERTTRQVTPTVDGEAFYQRCLLKIQEEGLGIIHVPRYHIKKDLASGALTSILDSTPPTPSPVSILYPRNRKYSPRVKVFIEWLDVAFGISHPSTLG